MAENHSKYEFMFSASLSQKLAFKHPLYKELAGSDPETSMSIAMIETLIARRLMQRTDKIELLLALLNAKRMALFATSEKTNEITKMGMQIPKREEEIDFEAGDPETPPE